MFPLCEACALCVAILQTRFTQTQCKQTNTFVSKRNVFLVLGGKKRAKELVDLMIHHVASLVRLNMRRKEMAQRLKIYIAKKEA